MGHKGGHWQVHEECVVRCLEIMRISKERSQVQMAVTPMLTAIAVMLENCYCYTVEHIYGSVQECVSLLGVFKFLSIVRDITRISCGGVQ